MANIVVIHGAWHTGTEMEPVAALLRQAGHQVWTPTVKGNCPGDSKKTGLNEAIQSIEDYFADKKIEDAVVVGHSYAGMIITGLADRMPERIRRLVYWNAFVPNDGECLNDLVPSVYSTMFNQMVVERGDGSVVLPFPVWRDVFINDADLDLATSSYELLNPHPYKTFTDRISLKTNPADMHIGKSYINCTEDIAMPHSMPWHPRLSEKLGLFRLVQVAGSHQLCFTNPERSASAIHMAGRD